LTYGCTVAAGSQSLKSERKLMCNRKLGSDTTRRKDIMILNLPEGVEESVFGSAECLLEDITWQLEDFCNFKLLSDSHFGARFKVLVLDDQLE
jgi:hypothetical protein